jgi:hypothetical protein
MNATRRASALGTLLAAIVTAAPAAAAVNLPGGSAPVEQVDFERHVMGLFSKAGCNAGNCHGSFQGKNGFRLSLFGYDPAKDHAALTHDLLGRRLNPVDPDNSLLLLKATGRTPHEGGARFGVDSWQYQLFRAWVAAGAPWQPGSGTVAGLTLDAPGYLFVKPGETRPIAVTARFADGSSEVVTPFCDFRTQDDAVAEVSSLGRVKAVRPGDTGLVVVYRGTVAAVRVLVPTPAAPGFKYPKVPEANYVDHEVLAKLRQLNVVPSDLAGDAEFLRRVTIDTIAGLPSPEEVRAFLADPSPDKRVRKIEELLAHPLHAALWATKMSDVTGNNTDALEQPPQLKAKRSQQWQDWLRQRFADNLPYDEIVRGILTATSREGMDPEEWVKLVAKQDEAIESGFDDTYKDRKTLDLFWRRQGAVQLEQWGEKVAAAFLGVRLECAQCHKHPTDRWTQADYRSFANLFAQINFGAASPEVKKIADKINADRRAAAAGKNANRVNVIREMYLGQGGTPLGKGNAAKVQPVKALTDPETGRSLPPKALGGPVLPIEPGHDVREDLFEWMASPGNPYFARSFVNRVWAHYFGVGLVEPVDDFSVANPPTNARLLDALAHDFVAHDYDVRHVERMILNSRTYQLSAVPNATNKFDKNNFARGYVRPMMAEAVVDVLNDALGAVEKFGADARADARMIEVGASRLQGNGNLAYALRIFGRPPRTTACDCERSLDPALPQTLYRMTDPAILGKVTANTGRLAKLLKANPDDRAVLEELFLATLTRLPTAAEKEAFAQYRGREKSRAAAFQDTLWALINTREFILNH